MNESLNIKNNIIFIHIPKNAGTSIAKSFGFEISSHVKASEILESFDFNFFKDKFSFGIVRDPIDRFISLYNYARMEVSYYHNNIHPSKSFYGKHLDYEILKNASLYECAKLLVEGKLIHDASWNHWKPQYTWIYDELGKTKLINKVYKINNLEELQSDLFNLFKLKFNFENLNKSSTNNKLQSVDSKTMSILIDYYRRDFELFDYKP